MRAGRFGDWDHGFRTGRRGLHNPHSWFAFGGGKYATWGVIQQLRACVGPKGDYLHSVLKFNTFMEQSSDDSRKLFDWRTISALQDAIDEGKLPDGLATLLFLKMVFYILMPIAEPNFVDPEPDDPDGADNGGPFAVVRSMWAGLYIMRLWRTYIRLSGESTLEKNFVTLEFYNTCEAMVHGATNYFLIAFRHRGTIPWRRCVLRLVADTRPQEPIFSLTRVGRFAGNSVNATLKVCVINSARSCLPLH